MGRTIGFTDDGVHNILDSHDALEVQRDDALAALRDMGVRHCAGCDGYVTKLYVKKGDKWLHTDFGYQESPKYDHIPIPGAEIAPTSERRQAEGAESDYCVVCGQRHFTLNDEPAPNAIDGHTFRALEEAKKEGSDG